MIEIGPVQDPDAVCMNESCCMDTIQIPPVKALMTITMGPTDDDVHNRCERCAGKMLVELVKTAFVGGGSETILIMSDADPSSEHDPELETERDDKNES